jgi:cysteine dioxygenase
MNSIIEHIKLFGFHNHHSMVDMLKTYCSDDYEKYICVNAGHYSKEKVFANDDFEIFVITWDKNQSSPIHDHSDNGCYMLILEGALIEEIYDSQNFTRKIKLNELKSRFIGYIHNNIGYHRIINPSSTEIAVSLHIYSPPNHLVKIIGGGSGRS